MKQTLHFRLGFRPSLKILYFKNDQTVFIFICCIWILLYSGLLLVQYVIHVYGNLKEWRKNPHWSISCCLALLLPLTDLPGEMNDLVGTNVMDDHTQSAEIETPTFFAAMSGVIDVRLEEDTKKHVNAMEVTKDTQKLCHQETQTELSTILCIADSSYNERATGCTYDKTSVEYKDLSY